MRYALAVTAVLLAAGCGGDGEASEPEPSSTPAVSRQTTCDRMFSQGPGEMGLWGETTDLVTDRAEGGSWDEEAGADLRDQLVDLAGSAEADLRPHIEAMAAAVDPEAELDVADYKTAGTEVANQCAEYVA